MTSRKESPNRNPRIVLTIFWTLLILPVGFTLYGFLVEGFGVGLFFRDDPVPKLHMRGEARLASVLSSASGFGPFVTSLVIRHTNRVLLGIGLTGCLFSLSYLGLPRF